MSQGPPGRKTWFKFFGQRYLMGGSLRAETTPDERAVWLDFLCLANEGGGKFDTANRDALATQLMFSRELLDRASKKFVATKRLSIHYDKKEGKEVFTVLKWGYYQAPEKSHKKIETAAATSPPHSPSLKKKDRKRDKERERERGENSAAGFLKKGENPAALFPPLPDIPKNLPFKIQDELIEIRANYHKGLRLLADPKLRQGFSEKEITNTMAEIRDKFITMLKDYTEP